MATVEQLVDMGFDPVRCRQVLQKHPNISMEDAIGYILDPSDGLDAAVEALGTMNNVGQAVGRPPSPQDDSGPPPLLECVDGDSSKAIVAVGPAKSLPPSTGGEDDLARAIALSMQEQKDREDFDKELKQVKGYTDPVNPWERRRESLNVPAGIKNVGNTCYINSLLQAFFMVPDFRAQILEFPIPQEDEALTEGQKLIRELQLLFTRMLLTERRYVDPQALVQFTAHSGAQEDPTELLLSLLEKIGQGVRSSSKRLRLSPTSGDGASEGLEPMDLGPDEDLDPSHNRDLVARFFEGIQLQKVEAFEEGDLPCSTTAQDTFQQLICSLPSQTSDALDLHDLLEQYTSPSVIEGYQTPRGRVTEARKIVFFERLPPILVIQMQRVGWTQNALRKNNLRITFPSSLFLDRYTIDNAEKTQVVRAQVDRWRQELSELEREKRSLMDWNGSSCPAVKTLENATSIAQRHCEGSLVDTIVSGLRNVISNVEKRYGVLVERIDSLQECISRAYHDFPEDEHYVLHAILVHAGSPDLGGHYWAYIVDHLSRKWFKFNDVSVGPVVNEEEMMREAFGDSNGATSAYALVYLQRSDYRAWNDLAGVPQWARNIVMDDNTSFQRELQAYQHADAQRPPQGASATVSSTSSSSSVAPVPPVPHKKPIFGEKELSQFESEFQDRMVQWWHLESGAFAPACILSCGMYIQARSFGKPDQLLQTLSVYCIVDEVLEERFQTRLSDIDPKLRGTLFAIAQVDGCGALDCINEYQFSKLAELRRDWHTYVRCCRAIHRALQLHFEGGDTFEAAMCCVVASREGGWGIMGASRLKIEMLMEFFANLCIDECIKATREQKYPVGELLSKARKGVAAAVASPVPKDGGKPVALTKWIQFCRDKSAEIPIPYRQDPEFFNLCSKAEDCAISVHANPHIPELSLARIADELYSWTGRWEQQYAKAA